MPPSFRALPVAAWVTAGEAIAWVGFARAVPVERWDLELALGLSLWPWHAPSWVRPRLRFLASDAAFGKFPSREVMAIRKVNADWEEGPEREETPYAEEMTPGHRSWLIKALRELESRRRPVGLPADSAGRPDERLRAERLRAEADRQCAAWDATVEAKVSTAFVAATLASISLCSSIARGDIAAFGVPTARSGAGTEIAPREAIPPAVFAGPSTLTPDGLYLFVPGDLSRSLGQGPAFAEILLPARDLARTFPRIPDKAPDLSGAASDRKPEPREVDTVAAQQAAKSEPVLRTGTAGRPSSMHWIHPEHGRRIAAGEARDSLAGEARYLREWFRKNHPDKPPPGQSALENALRDAHPEHLKFKPKKKRPG